MKYLTARILYLTTINDIPCQSLIPINRTLEYDEEQQCMLINDGEDDICIPITKVQYIGIVQNLKYSDVIDTNYYCFRYDESTFEQMNSLILQRNLKKDCTWEARKSLLNS